MSDAVLFAMVLVLVVVVAAAVAVMRRRDAAPPKGGDSAACTTDADCQIPPYTVCLNGTCAPDPTAPYTQQFIGMLSASVTLTSTNPVTIVSWDAATAALNPGVGPGSTVTSLVVAPDCNVGLTVTYPGVLSYQWTYPLSTLSGAATAPQPTGQTTTATWQWPYWQHTSAAETPVVVYISEIAGNGEPGGGGGFATEASSPGLTLSNWLGGYAETYLVIPFDPTDGSPQVYYARPYVNLESGYAIAMPPYVGNPQLAVFVPLTQDGDDQQSSPGATRVYNVPALEWALPGIANQGDVAAVMQTQIPQMVQGSGSSDVRLWFDPAANQLELLLGDYVFIGPPSSCYSELRASSGAPLTTQGGTTYAAVPRSALLAGPVTSWGTPLEEGDMGPLCVNGTTCQNLQGQGPCAALGAPYNFPATSSGGNILYYALDGSLITEPW